VLYDSTKFYLPNKYSVDILGGGDILVMTLGEIVSC